MALNVISNFAANVAHRHLTMSDKAATESVAKLSSGQRVLAAKDDAAALAIGTRLNAEEKALGQAQVNAGQAVSMLQIADGAMARTNDILVRMKTLAVQSSSGQLSNTERGMLNDEFTALRSEIDRIAEDTEFNGTQLINGSSAFDVTAQGNLLHASNGIENIEFTADLGLLDAGSSIGVSYDDTADQFTLTATDFGGNAVGTYTSKDGIVSPGVGETTDVVFADLGVTFTLNSQFETSIGNGTVTLDNTTEEMRFDTASATGTSSQLSLNFKIGSGTVTNVDDVDVSINSTRTEHLDSNLDTATIGSQGDAETSIGYVTNAIDSLAQARANVGASQNRLEFASENLATARENTEAARSDLMDLDVAKEMSNFTSKQILVQAGTSMLAQANQMPQNLLSLFR